MRQRQLDPEQIIALKKLICASRNCGEFCKKTMLWMIDKSHGLTEELYLNFPKAFYELGKLAGFGIHDAKIYGEKVKFLPEQLRSSFNFGSSCSKYDNGGWSTWLSLNETFRPKIEGRITADSRILAEIVEIKLIS